MAAKAEIYRCGDGDRMCNTGSATLSPIKLSIFADCKGKAGAWAFREKGSNAVIVRRTFTGTTNDTYSLGSTKSMYGNIVCETGGVASLLWST
jgi:hypothetical protein